MLEILKKRWVYHTLIWVSVFLLFMLLSYEGGFNVEDLLIQPLLIVGQFMYICYLGFWAKDHLFANRKYFQYILALAFIVVTTVLILEWMKQFGVQEGNDKIQNMTNVGFTLLFSTGLQYFKRGIIGQYQIQELRAKTAETELTALKAQINPHFLFNTLNNIYGMNQIDSSKGSDMILELSDVMRYHLEFSKMDHVRLEQEIELVQSYIRLEELRLTDNCDLQVRTSKVDKSLKISPLLFLPFVENAFKHGTHPLNPCFIHIRIDVDNEHILFHVKNSIISNRKVVKTHIGLENTLRRLELIYPERHTIDIKEEGDVFSVDLKIKI